jgi:hypothetical protein
MNLRTLFAIPIAVIMVVTLSLAGMVAGQGWSGLARGKAAIEAVERMRLLLALQTDLRAERVITNFVLGQPYPLTGICAATVRCRAAQYRSGVSCGRCRASHRGCGRHRQPNPGPDPGHRQHQT